MGVEDKDYNIPELVLGDTFFEWLKVTNDSIITKLNSIGTYNATGGDGINVTTSSAGLSEVSLADTIPNGVTFSGNVIFNGAVTTVNSTEITVDDFNLVLGATGSGKSDAYIGASGGGGILLMRADGPTASFLWRGMTTGSASLTFNALGVGSSGAWTCSEYLNLTGGVGLKSNDSTLRFKSGVNATGAGMMLKSIGTAGGPHMAGDVVYSSESMQLSHMGTGSVSNTGGVFFDEDGMVRIYNGVNKRKFTHASHGFTFGQSVRLNGFTCALAHANTEADAEVFGVVSEVLNSDEFVVTMQGEVHGDFGVALGSAGATIQPGVVYFLGGTAGNSGEISSSEITTAGKIRKPMLIGIGATAGYVLQYVGAKIAPEVDTVAPVMRRLTLDKDGVKQSGSSSITCAKIATGQYSLTHGFGSANYSVSVAGNTTGAVIGTLLDKQSNGCTIGVFGHAGSAVDCAAEIILAKDVS